MTSGLVINLRRTVGFFRIGYLYAVSYPLSFIMTQISGLMPLILFFFVDRQVEVESAAVGGDYFTFVVIGLVSTRVLSAGLESFGRELDTALQQGRFEMLLVEPVRWILLPSAMSIWGIVVRLVAATITLVGGVALGIRVDWSSFHIAMAYLAVGFVASFAIGTFAASIKVLAKRSDPLLVLYGFAVQLFSGVYFSVDELPQFLRYLSFLIPNTYVNTGVRKAMMPAGELIPGPSSTASLIVLTALAMLLTPLSLWFFNRSLNVGRKYGLLGGY